MVISTFVCNNVVVGVTVSCAQIDGRGDLTRCGVLSAAGSSSSALLVNVVAKARIMETKSEECDTLPFMSLLI